MNQHYWRYQLAGWLTLLLLDFISKALSNMLMPHLLFAVLVLYTFGLLASHGLRYIYKYKLRQFASWKVLPATFLLSFLAALLSTTGLMAVLYLTKHPLFIDENYNPLQIFQYNLFLMWLFLQIWSGLYLFLTRQRQVKDLQVQQQQLQENLQQSQLNALINQLNPHFMFNCINNIRALILEDPARARDMLAHMADMLRYNLQDNESSTETLEQELAIAHAFMQLASIQMEDRLRFTQVIDERIDPQLQVPRMIIQLLLENAVKHGIANLADGGEVCLNLKIVGKMLHIQVTNDGILGEQTSTGIGLKNIRSRLTMLYAEQATFTIKQQDKQVVAEATLPLTANVTDH